MADATFVLNQRLNGEDIKNVLVFSNVVPDVEPLQEWVDSIRALYNTYVVDRLWTAWSLNSVTVIFNDAPPVYSAEFSFTSGTLTGSVSAEGLPNQVALLVSTSCLEPPPNRGRIYFGGLTEADHANGLFSTAAAGDFQALVEAMAAGVSATAGDIYLRIARRSTAGIITLSNAVQNALGQRTPAIQRSRRLGG